MKYTVVFLLSDEGRNRQQELFGLFKSVQLQLFALTTRPAEFITLSAGLNFMRSKFDTQIIFRIFGIVFSGLFFQNHLLAADAGHVKLLSYNVEFGAGTTPEEVGAALKSMKLDVICFNEVPGGDWTEKVGKVLGMAHSFTGKISSANHKNKFKSILSRTPLEKTEEHALKAAKGWNPASAVRAVTKISGLRVAIYSLHVAGSDRENGHSFQLISKVIPLDQEPYIILAGDFNNSMKDPPMKLIEESGFRATWSDLQKIDLTKEFTWNARETKSTWGVIDHIFYRLPKNAKANDGGIVEMKKPLSDHKPVWAEIHWPATE